MPLGQKSLFIHTGVRTGCHHLISLSVSVCACVTLNFVVFTDCESCTRRISTNPASTEAGEYGLTRGTWFFARRLEVVAVAGLLWLSRCLFGEAGFFSISTTSTQPMAATDPDSSQRRLGEGAPTVSQSAHRAHLSPQGVSFSVLAPEKFGVIS